ncbi:MAG: hypothetical protein ACKVZ0_19780 [Gemmatimonadales bacterium]
MAGHLSGWLARLAFLIAAVAGSASSALTAQARREPFEWPRIGAGGSLPRLDLRRDPDLQIGTAVGPVETVFSGIAGAVRLVSGDIVIGDAGNHRLLYFGARGDFLRSVGRRGAGPGEFTDIRWLGRCANGALAVQDGTRGALAVFASAGRYLRSDPFPPDVHFDQVLWCSGSGRLLMLLNGTWRSRVEPGQYLSTETVLIGVHGNRVDTVAHPGLQDYYVAKKVAAFGSVPLGRRVLASAGGGRIYHCTNREARCVVTDTAPGAAATTFAIPLTRRRVRDGDWASVVAAYVTADPDRGVRKRLAAVVDELAPKTEFPLLDRVQADAGGNLWVRTFDNFGTEAASWVIVTPRGTPIGFVAAPRPLRITEIGVDYVLGFSEDTDGVERVELYLFARFLSAKPRG